MMQSKEYKEKFFILCFFLGFIFITSVILFLQNIGVLASPAQTFILSDAILDTQLYHLDEYEYVDTYYEADEYTLHHVQLQDYLISVKTAPDTTPDGVLTGKLHEMNDEEVEAEDYEFFEAESLDYDAYEDIYDFYIDTVEKEEKPYAYIIAYGFSAALALFLLIHALQKNHYLKTLNHYWVEED